ncbi:Hypothetical_protein [Hexamita inflata]|uniref:Hypothetical_protein n=1 Tax=Hexamita inflata TaxID=28002 RepID=A0AA86QUG8_9EUKA|nr:Hypothetical protein HINF_LOCUS53929 [Hexamita inflata]CAI9966288.1 Hypothetical protein HINF_LOCUS53933 [Hexamita inflata]CAI9970581.1 Hypothetical protein HINF_LOCUS58226 [Hexamita inflata]
MLDSDMPLHTTLLSQKIGFTNALVSLQTFSLENTLILHLNISQYCVIYQRTVVYHFDEETSACCLWSVQLLFSFNFLTSLTLSATIIMFSMYLTKQQCVMM